jgi:hypothetical protein
VEAALDTKGVCEDGGVIFVLFHLLFFVVKIIITKTKGNFTRYCH